MPGLQTPSTTALSPARGGLHLPRTGAGLRSPTSGQVGVPACFWLWPWLLSSPIGGFPPAPRRLSLLLVCVSTCGAALVLCPWDGLLLLRMCAPL